MALGAPLPGQALTSIEDTSEVWMEGDILINLLDLLATLILFITSFDLQSFFVKAARAFIRLLGLVCNISCNIPFLAYKFHILEEIGEDGFSSQRHRP